MKSFYRINEIGFYIFFKIQFGIYLISIDQIHFRPSNRRAKSMYLHLFIY